MKYIITAKNNFNGANDHITNPLERTEICTEMIFTRLKAIELLNTGVIDSSDCIVTRIDRRCLYDNLFENVIDYQDFFKGYLQPADPVFDLTQDINTAEEMMGFYPKYHRFEQDKKQILNIQLHGLFSEWSTQSVALLIRQTPNSPEKNISIDYWQNLIRELSKNYTVYVFGLPENFKFSNYLSYYHITNFIDWCSVLSSAHCKAVISSCSGGVYPAFFVSKPETKLIIIDNNNLVEQHKDSVSFYNDAINFTGVQKKIFTHIPKSEEMLSVISH